MKNHDLEYIETSMAHVDNDDGVVSMVDKIDRKELRADYVFVPKPTAKNNSTSRRLKFVIENED